MQHTHADYLEIVDYNDIDGTLVLSGPFNHYHWGKEDPPADENDFGGVDMRGEVILLSRNI